MTLQKKYQQQEKDFDLFESTPIRRDNIINTDRKITDWFCSLLLLICVAIWIAIDIHAYSNGDLYKLYGPIDVAGNFCGITKGFE
jgi:hypothetical protein